MIGHGDVFHLLIPLFDSFGVFGLNSIDLVFKLLIFLLQGVNVKLELLLDADVLPDISFVLLHLLLVGGLRVTVPLLALSATLVSGGTSSL